MATTFAVPDGRVAMAATTYTGNGYTTTGTQSITNTVNTVSFQPDLVWIKGRNSASNHSLTDSVRGTSSQLFSDLTYAQGTETDQTTAFNSNGFSVGQNWAGVGSVNVNTTTYVGWQWKAGGTAVSNTAGTITSSVSANTTAGFSVVTFTTPNLAAGATVGHGLGVAPSWVVVKGRNLVSGWQGYHISLGGTKRVLLNTTAAATTDSGPWNNTAPTSTVITLGGSFLPDTTSSYTYVAYCWAPVAGYSAFGSYTGNGSTDGPFVYTGFRPRFVLWRRTDVGDSWVLRDTARDTYNQGQSSLFAESSSAEATTSRGLDYLSNGFKLRQSIDEGNASGGTYIYAAFAENPLKYANAR